MANAMQCDRCDQFYKIPVEGETWNDSNILYKQIMLNANPGKAGRAYPIDLCPDCLHETFEFLKNPDAYVIIPEPPVDPEEPEEPEDSRE